MRRFVRIFLPAVGIFLGWVMIFLATSPQTDLPDLPELRQALDTLADYGYKSSEMRGDLEFSHLVWCGVGLAVTLAGWYCLCDYRERRKIWRVIDYAREINRRVYNLKLEENSEDELSLLSNELYKTTVILQEAAETECKRAGAMERALEDISHQLKTPLTALTLAIDNLHDNPEMEEADRQEFLGVAGRLVKQMSELTAVLLNLAKLDNGTLKMHRKWVKVGDLIQTAVEGLEILAEVRGVNIAVTGDTEARLLVDAGWQAEALANIVKNSIEHSPADTEVKLTVRSTAVFTKITVMDMGEGILAEEMRHIFERFYQASNATPESVGIGLALARELIEADNGQVRVRSTAGKGTEFVVTYYKV